MRRRYLLHTTILCGAALLTVPALANPQGGVVTGVSPIPKLLSL